MAKQKIKKQHISRNKASYLVQYERVKLLRSELNKLNLELSRAFMPRKNLSRYTRQDIDKISKIDMDYMIEHSYTPKNAAQKPASKKPASEKPASKKPASEKPASKKPASKKPASKKPAFEKPASKKPVSEKPYPDTQKSDQPASRADISYNRLVDMTQNFNTRGAAILAELLERTIIKYGLNAVISAVESEPELMSLANTIVHYDGEDGDDGLEHRAILAFYDLLRKTSSDMTWDAAFAQALTED